jgi:hypothetical protein
MGQLVIRKTNPIQSQFKPNQSQFWADFKGGKAKTKPIQTQLKPIMPAIRRDDISAASNMLQLPAISNQHRKKRRDLRGDGLRNQKNKAKK